MSLQSDATEFEKLMVSLHQAILNAEGFENIEVKHNVTLLCKSGATAQFDVYWEFKQAGITYKVAIECKNYSNSVSVGDVREFADKLMDAGIARGIMVTRIGYQDGAKKVAKDRCINLKKFQFPLEMDWTGRVRTIILKITGNILKNIRPEFIVDKEWCSMHYPGERSFTSDREMRSDEVIFVKEDGTRIKNLREIESELPRGENTAQNLEETVCFSEPTFMKTPGWPLLKINSVCFIYDVLVSEEEHKINADDFVQGLLLDDETGESFLWCCDITVRVVDTISDKNIKDD